jgi:hypothetical protein
VSGHIGTGDRLLVGWEERWVVAPPPELSSAGRGDEHFDEDVGWVWLVWEVCLHQYEPGRGERMLVDCFDGVREAITGNHRAQSGYDP